MGYKIYEEGKVEGKEITLRLFRGVECGGNPGDIYVGAVSPNGMLVNRGLLVRFSLDKTVSRMAGVNKEIGFKLDDLGCIVLSEELEGEEE